MWEYDTIAASIATTATVAAIAQVTTVSPSGQCSDDSHAASACDRRGAAGVATSGGTGDASGAAGGPVSVSPVSRGQGSTGPAGSVGGSDSVGRMTRWPLTVAVTSVASFRGSSGGCTQRRSAAPSLCPCTGRTIAPRVVPAAPCALCSAGSGASAVPGTAARSRPARPARCLPASSSPVPSFDARLDAVGVPGGVALRMALGPSCVLALAVHAARVPAAVQVSAGLVRVPHAVVRRGLLLRLLALALFPGG